MTICEKVVSRLNKHDDVIEWNFMKIAPPTWRAGCAPDRAHRLKSAGLQNNCHARTFYFFTLLKYELDDDTCRDWKLRWSWRFCMCVETLNYCRYFDLGRSNLILYTLKFAATKCCKQYWRYAQWHHFAVEAVVDLGFEADQVHVFHCSWDSYTTFLYPQVFPHTVPVVSSPVQEIFKEMQD